VRGLRAEIDAMVARTAPAALELLRDGTPCPKSVIIAALADRHPKEDVVRTLMRLAVTGQLRERERKYSLAPGQKGEPGARVSTWRAGESRSDRVYGTSDHSQA
jgi:hypothetical protein